MNRPVSPSRPAITRTIDANLLADRFEPGATAVLTVTIRLPASAVRGKWQGFAQLMPDAGPVRIAIELAGFKLTSSPPPPIEVPEDKDAAPVAFELLIEPAERRWLHILLTQDGQQVGDLCISDFASLGSDPVRQREEASWRRIAEADLMLVVRAGSEVIEASSPRDRACLDHVPMPGFHYPATQFRDALATQLRALYDVGETAADRGYALRLVGAELAKCLPADLVSLLRGGKIKTVMLRHEDDFDFPLELCYLDDETDPFFVGDRIAICRWYLGVKNLPDTVLKTVRRAAFLKGTAAASSADETYLRQRFDGRVQTFASEGEVRRDLFQTAADFDVIHFTGHCRQQRGQGVLELADGTNVLMTEIGQLRETSRFAAAQPFVVLNACASAQPYLGLIQRDSFARRFVASDACAFIGTLWPVEEAVASEFIAALYAELKRLPIGSALIAAKASVLRSQSTDEDSTLLLNRQVAVRSYCLFANPDLRLAA